MRTWLDRVAASAAATSLAFTLPLSLAMPAHAGQDPGCAAWASGAGPAPAPTSCHSGLQEGARKATRIASRSMSQNEWLEREVMTLDGGRGDKSSEVFKLTNDFEIRWESEGDDFELVLHKGSGLKEIETKVVGLTKPGQGTKGYPRGPGDYFVEVTANGAWSVTVVEKGRDITYDYNLTVQTKVRNPFSFPIRIRYDFGDSTTKDLDIGANEEATITEPLSLTDLEERYSNERLLKEVSPLTIHSILNASSEAEAARTRQDVNSEEVKAAREAEAAAAEESRRQRLDAATAEYKDTDIQERRKDKSRKEQEALALNRDARDAETSRKRKWIITGSAIGIVGIGSGIALTAVGGGIRSDAKGEYDAAQQAASSDPTPAKTLRLQEAKSRLDRGNSLLGVGIGLTVVGAVGAGVCIAMALRSKKANSASRAWQPNIAPLLVRSGGGLIFSTNF